MSKVRARGKLGDFMKIRAKRGLLLPELEKVVLAEAGDDEDRRQDVIHVSEMSKPDWCPLSTYYRIAGWTMPDERFSMTLENIYEEGNTIHDKWQNRMRKTGQLYGLWECAMCHEFKICRASELDYRSDPDWADETNPAGTREDYCPLGYGEPLAHMWEYREVHMDAEETHLITAHADGAMADLNCLVEIKSIGLGTLRLDAPKLLSQNYHKLEGSDKKAYDLDAIWKGLSAPLTSHQRQGQLYLWVAKQAGLPFDTLVFLYEFKPNQQVKEFTVTLVDEIVQPMLDEARQIKLALDNIHYAPPKCPKGGCKYCLAIEEVNADKEPLSGYYKEQEHVAYGSGLAAGSGHTDGAENHGRSVGEPARRRTTRRSPGHYNNPGRGTDGAVPQAEPMGKVPDDSGSSGTGRRVLRRNSGVKDRGQEGL